MKKYFPLIFINIILVLFTLSCNSDKKNHKKRILTLGIRNESNTFSTLPTKEPDFNVLRGTDVLKDQMWAKLCQDEGIELIPTLHAYAWPGGVVEQEVFDKFKNEILDSIKKAGKIDGIYMDMHGALHAKGYDDVQASLIQEIRNIVGDKVLISGSFDLHGNLSQEFVSNINILTALRTAPHRDGSETKVRALRMLIDALNQQLKPYITCVTIPILVPGEKSITEVEPLHSIYAQIPEVAAKDGLMDASIFAGYCWADLPRSAMRVFVVAKDKKYENSAQRVAINLAGQIWNKRADMKIDVPSGSIDAMIAKAKEFRGKTVFISDSGDNTTAGAPGDNTQVLEALLRNKTKNALLAGIVDSEALQQCINKGKGNTIELTIGGKVDSVFSKPLTIRGKIEFLSPDSILHSKRGAAVVSVNDIKLVIMNTRRSFTEIRDFKEVELDPLKFDIVIVKLGYLYPQLRDLAPVHLMALTTGFCNLDMRTLPFKHVQRPSYPLDLDMNWTPTVNY